MQLILRADAVDAMPAIDVPGSELTILIGPEGGFSEAEHERAAAAGLRAVRLGVSSAINAQLHEYLWLP